MTASNTVSTFQLQLIYITKYRHYGTWIFLPKPTKFGITQVAICLWFTFTIVIFNRWELCINAYYIVWGDLIWTNLKYNELTFLDITPFPKIMNKWSCSHPNTCIVNKKIAKYMYVLLLL